MSTKCRLNRFLVYNIRSGHMFWLLNVFYKFWWLSERFAQIFIISFFFSFHQKCTQNGKIRSIGVTRAVFHQNDDIPLLVKIKLDSLNVFEAHVNFCFVIIWQKKLVSWSWKSVKVIIPEGRQKSMIEQCS